MDYSISSILSYIKSLFTSVKVKQPSTPTPLILTGTINRSMSSRELAADINSRLESLGIPTDPILEDGTPNLVIQSYYQVADAIITHLVTNAKVEIAIKPAAIRTQSTGTDATGTPVTTTGINRNIVKGVGVIK